MRIISGATYSGVPQNVHVFLPNPILLAKPKSTYKFPEIASTLFVVRELLTLLGRLYLSATTTKFVDFIFDNFFIVNVVTMSTANKHNAVELRTMETKLAWN